MDLERIDQLLQLLNEQKVAEFNYEDESVSLTVRFGGAVVTQMVAAAPVAAAVAAPAAAAPAAAPAAADDPSQTDVPSPMVGTFYRAASPDTPPFVKLGDRVSRGQTLCIVEAMKLMNEIESEVEGVVTAILVENAQPVQFGQSLFKIKEG
jgi:acetyl-CoA carboxylase biotin carboxyl carrier protein